ncbi:MAG: hypothetical protein AAF488_07660, partial [Planctomycetota bacterium]
MTSRRTSRRRQLVWALVWISSGSAIWLFGSVTRWRPSDWLAARQLGYWIQWSPRRLRIHDASPRNFSRNAIVGYVGTHLHESRAAVWRHVDGKLVLVPKLSANKIPRNATATCSSGEFVVGMGFDATSDVFGWIHSPNADPVQIPGFGKGHVRPRAVNNRGHVVGIARGSNGFPAFLWTEADGVQALGTTGRPYDINDKGWVIGNHSHGHAFLWRPDQGLTKIPSPPGLRDGMAVAINEHGHVLVDASSGTARNQLLSTYLWSENHGYREVP